MQTSHHWFPLTARFLLLLQVNWAFRQHNASWCWEIGSCCRLFNFPTFRRYLMRRKYWLYLRNIRNCWIWCGINAKIFFLQSLVPSVTQGRTRSRKMQCALLPRLQKFHSIWQISKPFFNFNDAFVDKIQRTAAVIEYNLNCQNRPISVFKFRTNTRLRKLLKNWFAFEPKSADEFTPHNRNAVLIPWHFWNLDNLRF